MMRLVRTVLIMRAKGLRHIVMKRFEIMKKFYSSEALPHLILNLFIQSIDLVHPKVMRAPHPPLDPPLCEFVSCFG